MTTPSRRQWTDDTIREELLPIAEELGRFPRKTELTERGIGGLWAAMGRRGGVDAWREVVAAHLAAAPAPAPVAAAEAVAAVEAPAFVAGAGAAPGENRDAAGFPFPHRAPGDPGEAL